MPYMKGNEKKYVNDCLDSTWISSKGKYIELFEHSFSEYLGVKYACSVNNGTTALHMALLALDIKPGDEIIVPTFTYIASVNAISYMGAVPVFVDSIKETWQIDPDDVKRKITAKTKAVIIVHLYGHPCDMDAIVPLCKDNNILLVEDCAEAIGSYYKGKHVGCFGDIATFSFFGNKTITTGEGGMVVSNNENLITRSHHIKNQGVTNVQYWHDIIGYNYRMTNICAAIGLAQLEQIEHILQLKKTIAETYRKAFLNTDIEFLYENDDVVNSFWMCSCLIKSAKQRDQLRDFLQQQGIETRPLFYPVHSMPIYNHLTTEDFPVANSLSTRGINLPSYPGLTEEDVYVIANKIIQFVNCNEYAIGSYNYV
jgi:perosamine synthetase